MADVAAGISAFRARQPPERSREERNFLTLAQPLGSGWTGKGVVCMWSAMPLSYEVRKNCKRSGVWENVNLALIFRQQTGYFACVASLSSSGHQAKICQAQQ